MAGLAKLPLWSGGGLVHVVVETPRASRVKIAYDDELECFAMSRVLMVGLAYPHDWGFLPSTRGEDGDPLDALVIHDAPTSTGLVIRCRIVGALKVKQTVKGRNERNDLFFAVPQCDPEAHLLQDIRNWAKEMRGQMEQFFCASVAREDKELAFLGWAGPKEALKLIKAGEQALTRALIKS